MSQDRPRRLCWIYGCLGLSLSWLVVGAMNSLAEPPSGATRSATAAEEATGNRPEGVLSWRHCNLTEDEYARRAEAWEAWSRAHPSDVRALVEWGRALRYVGGHRSEVDSLFAEAFSADSTDAVVIDAYAPRVWLSESGGDDWALAHQRLLRAAREDSTYADTYYVLWLTSLQVGDTTLARHCLDRVVELGDMPAPLLDFGYNLLASAPPSAIVFTNGDNDTYPPLALQARLGFRRDVSIVNVSLLNLPWYIRRAREAGVPLDLNDAAIAALKATPERSISAQAQLAMAQAVAKASVPRPVCYATTVGSTDAIPGDRVLEGLVWRVLPPGGCGEKGTTPCFDLARTRDLFDTLYRLDSATDPLLDWSRENSVARLAPNYATLLYKVGDGLLSRSPREEGGPYLYKALKILAFHAGTRGAANLREEILQTWTAKDPGSVWLTEAKKLTAR